MLKVSVQSLECLANVAAINSNHDAKGDPPLEYQAYLDLLLSTAVQHDQRNQLSVKKNHRLQHTINYLDMDYQDYASLAGPSPGEYADSYSDNFEVHRTFQQTARSQQTLTSD